MVACKQKSYVASKHYLHTAKTRAVFKKEEDSEVEKNQSLKDVDNIL